MTVEDIWNSTSSCVRINLYDPSHNLLWHGLSRNIPAWSVKCYIKYIEPVNSMLNIIISNTV